MCRPACSRFVSSPETELISRELIRSWRRLTAEREKTPVIATTNASRQPLELPTGSSRTCCGDRQLGS